MSARRQAARRAGLVFLFDLDDTLIDNDRIQEDVRRHLQKEYGSALESRHPSAGGHHARFDRGAGGVAARIVAGGGRREAAPQTEEEAQQPALMRRMTPTVRSSLES